MSKRTRPIVEASPPPIPAGNEETVSEFLLKYGRMPFITDERKPWTYKGWLLLLVQMMDFYPGMPNRWPYYLNTIEEQRLTDEPIPQVQFDSGGPGSPGFKMAEKCLRIIENFGRASSSIREFLWWLGFGLGVSKETCTLDDKAQEELYRTFNAEIWMRKPADYFGDLICEYKGKGWRNGSGFYPTPHSLCEMMARLTWGEPQPAHRIQKFMEPCIGTGRTALHASNYSLRLYGQDIDDLVVMACKVNGALYAPWLAFPFPERFFEQEDLPPPEVLALPAITDIIPSIPTGMLFDLGDHHAEDSQQGRVRHAVSDRAASLRRQKERDASAQSLFDLEEG